MSDLHDAADPTNPAAPPPTVLHQIAIPAEEWARLRRLGLVTGPDEREVSGCVRLHTEGGRRCWDATDGRAAARIYTEPDASSYDVLIPNTLVRYGYTAADVNPFGGEASDATTTLQVCVDESLRRYLTLTTPIGSLTVGQPGHLFPDLDETVFSNFSSGAEARLKAESLHDTVQVTRVARQPIDDDADGPDYHFGIVDGAVSIDIDWPGLGCSSYRIAAETTGRPASRVVPPAVLDRVIAQFDADDMVTVMVSGVDDEAVLFAGGPVIAGVLATPSMSMCRERVEAIIAEAVGPLGVQRDHDGHYPLQRRVLPVLGQLNDGDDGDDGRDGDPDVFSVFAVLLDDILASTELLVELNDLNRNLGFARLVHADGQVVVQIDLPTDTMISEELRDAIERITDIGQRVMPMLAAVFGGIETVDPERSRWDDYRQVLVTAEVRPGTVSKLTGTTSLANWPFPGPVYVLSGWNPQGIEMDDESSDSVNAMIAQDILGSGGRFVHGTVFVPGIGCEPSLIAWGLSREDALAIGRKASRDAVLRIDDSEARLLSCTSERTEAWPRRHSERAPEPRRTARE